MSDSLQRLSPVSEREYLEDNIATVAFHLGQPGARLSVQHDKSGVLVDPGAALKEISRRLTADHAQRPAAREAIAKIIYDAFPFEPRLDHAQKPEWVPGGNSIRQDEARRAADKICALSLSSTDRPQTTYSQPSTEPSLHAAAEHVCWFDWSDNDADAVAAINVLRKVLASSVGKINEIIEECARVADAARESAKEHHGIEASIGADIAARRIRALAVTSPEGNKP
jgi:hypothetical protein